MDTSIQTLKLELIKRYDRPSFEYNEVMYLMDTGAHMPVWCSGEELFLLSFPKAEKTTAITHLSGFGSGQIDAVIYRIPEFALGDNKTGRYMIRNLFVAVADYDRIGFDFILSATMFAKADYTISNAEKTLVICYDKEVFEFTPIMAGDSIEKITVWAQ